jgi:hypothetical protein
MQIRSTLEDCSKMREDALGLTGSGQPLLSPKMP